MLLKIITDTVKVNHMSQRTCLQRKLVLNKNIFMALFLETV